MAPSSLLEKNLAALSKVDRALYERVCGPVDNRHVVEQPGKRFLKVHHTLVPLEVSPQECAQLSVSSEQVFVFGLGQGEMVESLLKTHKSLKVFAWERDAWMMRLALGRIDFARAMAQGRLVLKMGVDLVDMLPLSAPVLEHPRLAQAYTFERALLASGWGEKRALVCSGALFVEDVASMLREEGYSVFPFELHKLSPEELQHVVKRARPQCVVSINYSPGLAEFLAPTGAKLIVWEIDPATDWLPPVASATTHAHVFTYRAANVAEFQKLGFRHVAYLPLAANVARRKPVTLDDTEKARYAAAVSFVGSSMKAQADAYRQQFVTLAAAFGGASLLEEGLALQRLDFTRFSLKSFLEQRAASLLASVRKPGAVDPLMLAAEVAAFEKRLAYVEAVGQVSDIAVWGDEGWKALKSGNCRYLGHAGHYFELNKVYSSSRINLDIGRIYQADIVTMRVFDVLACGGFILAEHSEALAELFDIGQEVESYRTLPELLEKVRFYLRHPEKAQAIASKGAAAVRERHSMTLRVRHMLKQAGLAA